MRGGGLLLLLCAAVPSLADETGTLRLTLRKRIETQPKSGRFHTVSESVVWSAKSTAIIVCDMWDLHHGLNATRRVGELAPRLNEVLTQARKQGVTIIHAPSSCMDAYKEHPARQRALATPRSKSLPKDIGAWCHRLPAEEQGTYPIDQSDGGEDDDPDEHRAWADKLKQLGRNPRAPWKSQHNQLTIAPTDFLSDSGEEIWSILEAGKISNVILVGVHTNMCVLGRPFGLRQMTKNGKNVVLIRDLTDTMYNPARAPYVSHFTGTDLIVEHIEKYVCPTITSDQLIGGKPFRFAADHRPHVVLILAEDEYQTERTLPAFARAHLGKEFRVSEVFGDEQQRDSLPGLEVLEQADLVVVSVRRRLLPKEQLALLRQYVARGKPLVGLRTASHAFSPRGKAPIPEGRDSWPEFDRDVLGGNYRGHHSNKIKTTIQIAKGAEKHPILHGVNVEQLQGFSSLYRTSPLVSSTTTLLLGTIPEQSPEPVAWVNLTATGGRVFYTSLGHPDDFQQPAFVQLLHNAVRWASGLSQR